MATKGNLLTTNESSADNPLAAATRYSYNNNNNNSTKITNSNNNNKGSSNGGGLVKSNFSSSDNPLVNPAYSYDKQQQQQQQQPNYNNNNNSNPGGLIKSNLSSNDNPLNAAASNNYRNNNNNNNNNNYYTPNQHPHSEPWRKINTYTPPASGIHFPADSLLPPIQQQQNNLASSSSSALYSPSLESYQKQPVASNVAAYQPSNPLGPRASYQYNDDPAPFNYQSFKEMPMPTQQQQQQQQQQSAANNNLSERQARNYDFQMADRELDRFLEEKNRKLVHNEIYPPYYSSNNNNNSMTTTYNSSYQPFGSAASPSLLPRLNKDMIVEKPNSLSADLPPYDPIKDRSGLHQGYNYDPWGKPGAGAPLIDPVTGRKFTKMSGQVWYDTIGMSPDDRARAYLDKNRPLTLEEQKYEMEVEKERKRFEDAVYRSRAGDVATWIQELEDQRKLTNKNGARLPHTNVTREKINLEYARRLKLNDSTKAYHEELAAQLEERQRENKLYKLRDDIAGIEHVRRWDDWWGRPGGGAPNLDGKRRHNLEEKLEDASNPNMMNLQNTLPIRAGVGQQQQQQQQYQQASNIDASLLYGKASKNSSHKNLYDNLQPMK